MEQVDQDAFHTLPEDHLLFHELSNASEAECLVSPELAKKLAMLPGTH